MRVTSLCEMIIWNSFKIKMGKAPKGPQGDTLPGAESQVNCHKEKTPVDISVVAGMLNISETLGFIMQR